MTNDICLLFNIVYLLLCIWIWVALLDCKNEIIGECAWLANRIFCHNSLGFMLCAVSCLLSSRPLGLSLVNSYVSYYLMDSKSIWRALKLLEDLRLYHIQSHIKLCSWDALLGTLSSSSLAVFDCLCFYPRNL